MNKTRRLSAEDINIANAKYLELNERFHKVIIDKKVTEKIKNALSEALEDDWKNLLICLKKINNGKDCFYDFSRNAAEIARKIEKAKNFTPGHHFLVDENGKLKIPKDKIAQKGDEDFWGRGK